MPPNRPTPVGAARAAAAAAANVTRGIEQALISATEASKPRSGGPESDGRKQRWERHKTQRREQLVEGTIAAISKLGSHAGMDEIAGHIGVSKTVLYRYFTDKGDLARSVSASYFQNTLLPRLLQAIVEDRAEFDQTRGIISAFVTTVADAPQVYRFVSGRATAAFDEPEAVVVKLITAVLSARLTARESDVRGAAIWSHAVVGATRNVVNWWIASDTDSSAQDVIDYLTMLLWSAAVGVAQFDGSRERFFAAPPPLPPVSS
ncbi:TetR/AcrR family transcriptional regulator [Gordonia sp. CPCC 205333]|uniref:TetR/AcrR family transcriptional regulator n=1 Tax=Gordonia sp. CPCC 205333 TaxID=3140790 RepID=UPI003AF3A099